MTTMTIAYAAGGFSADDLDRAAGRADAYDDHATLTLEELNVRAAYITDLHPNLAYAQGYSAYAKEAQLELAFVTGRAPKAPRKPLPVRRRLFVGPMGAHEQAAIRAALASAKAGLPVTVRAWDGPTARLEDGTVLTHTPAHTTTDQAPAFHAAIRCPHGAVHTHTIHSARDLHRARLLTTQCDQRTDQPPAGPTPNPAVRNLGDGLTRAKSATADTGSLPAVDTETAKEHPQP